MKHGLVGQPSLVLSPSSTHSHCGSSFSACTSVGSMSGPVRLSCARCSDEFRVARMNSTCE